jgi:pimeloyl-ACP methyl ester carboxylesterase
MMEIRPPVLLGDFLACNEFNLMEQLPRIKPPTVLICGAEDKMTPVKYSEFLREAISGAQLHIVENAGHLVMLEQPDVVADLLKQFVESIPPRVRKPRKKKEGEKEEVEVTSIPSKSELHLPPL